MEGFEEWCEAQAPDGRARREGPARTYYDDGGLWIESTYHEGLLDGAFVERYRGGKIARQGAYQAGLRTGPWRFFHETGSLLEESSWTRGVPDGPFVDYWPSGKERNVGRRCLGAQCGKWTSYDDSGRLLGSMEYGDQRTAP
jgi:antitoxin component YwqK of YwqJK toxin-antitoxin module